MSSFYDDASLVVIPSGYKTSKIYAEKPTDGSGDLTFTRASGATRVGPNGLIEEVRTNLVPNGLSFNASTGVLYTTVTSDSPISGVSSTRITKNEAAGTLRYGNQNASASVLAGSINYTISRYFKFDGHNVTTSLEYSSTGNWGGTVWVQNIDIASTGVTLQTPTGCTSKVTNVGNGWYRVEVAILNGASPSGSPVNYLLKVPSSLSTGQGFLTAAPQLETGDVATNYIPTTTAAVSVGPVSNVPRLDYLGSSCPRLLLEPQITALNQFSESFDNSYWQLKTDVTISANSTDTLDPSGYYGADKITETATTARHRVAANAATLTTANHTASVFMKKGTARYGFVTFSAGTVFTIVVDLEDGTITATSTSGTIVAQKVENYGNGWYRISVTGLSAISGSSQYNLQFGSAGSATPSYNANIPSFAGSTSNYLYAWGANLTATSYLQSYIPTLAASVTRVADAASKTGITSLIGQTEGTIFAEIYPEEFVNGSYISISDGANIANRIIFGFEVGSVDSGTLRVFGATGLTGSGTYNRGQRIKVAIGYKSGSSVLYVNGNLVNTSTSTFSLTLTRFAFDSYAGTQNFVGRCSQALLFKTRLTNSQLAELTTL